MKSLLVAALWMAFAPFAFATETTISSAHETALAFVSKEKIAPPMVAYAFAAANLAGAEAYAQNEKSHVAYTAAFYRIWDRMPKGGNLAESFAQAQTSATESREARSGMEIADRFWAAKSPRFLAATNAERSEASFDLKWEPTPPNFQKPLLPHWGEMELWGASSSVEMVSKLQPPQTESGAFLRDLLEVRELGGINSQTRTPEQTLIAKFWAAGGGTVTPPGMWIEITLDLIERRALPFEAALTILTKVSSAMSDAGVLCWHTKFAHNIWRPVSAIQHLIPGSNWQPLLDTPPFPAYVSGHSSFSAAAATVIEHHFGKNQPVEARSAAAPGHVRSFLRAQEAAAEAGMSRIYGGIHYAADNQDGLTLGRLAACSVLGLAACDQAE